MLHLNSADAGIHPTPELTLVWGLVMDTTDEVGGYSLVALADGTTSLYTTTGGGMIGAGEQVQVAAATRAALRVVEAHLDQLPPATNSDLPPVGSVVLRALSYDGQRAVQALERDLGEGRHPQSDIFHAAHYVIAHLRFIEESRGRQPR